MTQRHLVSFCFSMVTAMIVACVYVLSRFGDMATIVGGWSSVPGGASQIVRLALTGVVALGVALFVGLGGAHDGRAKKRVLAVGVFLGVLNWNLLSMVPVICALAASAWWCLTPNS